MSYRYIILLYNKEMSVCPKCNTEIDEDFGLVDCSGCGVAVLVGIDGEVQVAGDTPDSPPSFASQNEDSEVVAQESDFKLDSFVESSFSNQVSDSSDEATNFNFNLEAPNEAENNGSEFLFSDNDSQEQESTNHQTSFGGTQVESQAVIDEFTSFNELVSEVTNQEPLEPTNVQGQADSINIAAEVSEIFNEQPNTFAEHEITKSKIHKEQTEIINLSEFANSNSSSIKDGYLKYKLYIGGIDTDEIKKQVFGELADKNLLLDLGSLDKSIVDGSLCVEPLSAVKASIIINRLKGMPISILWDQYDIRKA